jgi:hypothetical protein
VRIFFGSFVIGSKKIDGTTTSSSRRRSTIQQNATQTINTTHKPHPECTLSIATIQTNFNLLEALNHIITSLFPIRHQPSPCVRRQEFMARIHPLKKDKS